MPFDWYEILEPENNSLHQGDIIRNCPIFYPPEDVDAVKEGEQDISYSENDVIVLSQSCDLIAKKISIVQVCPIGNIDEHEWIAAAAEGKERDNRKESIRRGYQHGFHLLKECTIEDHEFSHLYVDFRNTYGVDLQFLENYVESMDYRVRLLPPYKEHLSQAFARFFMRVGLPSDIPRFDD